MTVELWAIIGLVLATIGLIGHCAWQHKCTLEMRNQLSWKVDINELPIDIHKYIMDRRYPTPTGTTGYATTDVNMLSTSGCRDRHGLTLIELLIVIAIICIIASIALPHCRTYIKEHTQQQEYGITNK